MGVSKPKKQKTIAIGCVFNDRGEVLLSLRHEPEIPKAHNKWEFPGGGVDFGETPEETVIREIFEETGVRAKVDKLLPVIYTGEWEHDNFLIHVIIIPFRCTTIGGQLKLTDKKVTDAKWITPAAVFAHKDLHDNIAPMLRLALEN